MKIDAWIGLPEASSSHELAGIGARARTMEQDGYSGLLSAETSHDPFLPLALAAQHTESIELMTAIAVGFARNPMVLAHTAWDLQALSGGRFLLGLGSQIQPHITKRFSMPWSKPRSPHGGDDRRHPGHLGGLADRRAPQFPGRLLPPHADDAHVQPRPDRRAAPADSDLGGGAADDQGGWSGRGRAGVPRLPDRRVSAGGDAAQYRGRAGRSRGGTGPQFQISMPVFVVSGFRDDDIAAQATKTRTQIAFYGSTPAYRGVLDHHGWGDAQTDLNRLSKQGNAGTRWAT